MPKIKTNKTAAKRFGITGTGLFTRTKGGKSHLRRKKPGRVKRLYDAKLPLHPSDKARIKRLIPYS